jgi:hypothetical protein
VAKYENQPYSKIVKLIYNSKENASSLSRISSFWKGGSLVSMGCGPAHAAFFAVHEINKEKIMQMNESFRPILFAIGGGVACFFHDLVMTPFDALK